MDVTSEALSPSTLSGLARLHCCLPCVAISVKFQWQGFTPSSGSCCAWMHIKIPGQPLQLSSWWIWCVFLSNTWGQSYVLADSVSFDWCECVACFWRQAAVMHFPEPSSDVNGSWAKAILDGLVIDRVFTPFWWGVALPACVNLVWLWLNVSTELCPCLQSNCLLPLRTSDFLVASVKHLLKLITVITF